MAGLVVREKDLLKKWLEVPDLAIREKGRGGCTEMAGDG